MASISTSSLAQRAIVQPVLARHGIRLDVAQLGEPRRALRMALNDPRSLGLPQRGTGGAIRDLARTLDHLERRLAGGRRGPGRPRLQRQAR
jgi:hypothetical protein